MILNLTLLVLLVLGWTIPAIFILAVNILLYLFGKRFFAGFCYNFVADYNELAGPFKEQLFAELNMMQPADGGKLKILEIGGGSGANFKYFKVPAVVDIVEPNPHFVTFFDKTRAEYASDKLQINDMKQGYGEDLKAAGIPDSSVDAVIMTLVLCSVQDQEKCIKEIQRVLKPGGKFFYMEHILAKEGDTLLRTIQQIVSKIGLWPCLFDGCFIDRPTDMVMEKCAGWDQVKQTRYELPQPRKFFFKTVREAIKPHVFGVAMK